MTADPIFACSDCPQRRHCIRERVCGRHGYTISEARVNGHHGTPQRVAYEAKHVEHPTPVAVRPWTIWQHHSGRHYGVICIANMPDGGPARPTYPPTVFYFNIENFRLYTGALHDWHRRMTLVTSHWVGDVLKDEVLSRLMLGGPTSTEDLLL